MSRPRRSRRPDAPPGTAVGYLRVSTDEQADSGAGLAAQLTTIETECARRGWELVATHTDPGVSGSVPPDQRPGLVAALAAVEVERTAAALVTAKLDRLSRSVRDYAELLERTRRERWALVASDLGVDTSTPQGEAMSTVSMAFAQLERRLIGQRTREALAERAAAGVRLGRPPVLDDAVRSYVVLLREVEHLSWPAIAQRLRDEEVPTAHGGRWWPGTCQQVHRRWRERAG